MRLAVSNPDDTFFLQTVSEKAAMNPQHTSSWPDLAIGLYEPLTGRNAEIAYEFVDMHV